VGDQRGKKDQLLQREGMIIEEGKKRTDELQKVVLMK